MLMNSQLSTNSDLRDNTGILKQFTNCQYMNKGRTRKMETTFYHDTMSMDAVKKMKSNMSLPLDFNGGNCKPKNNIFNKAQASSGLVLASPDLNMLKLASPELERMIIQQNGMVTTTPTPTQFAFPRTVTEEQEAYARGFVDALAELHHVQPSATTAVSMVSDSVAMNRPVSASSVSSVQSGHSTGMEHNYNTLPQYTTLTTTTNAQLPGLNSMSNHVQSQSSMQMSNGYGVAPMMSVDITNEPHQSVLNLKEEPQTVPCLGYTPPMSPINMEHQEGIKLERKRARNRVAASKCRLRKLDRISRLEVRVDELKGQNSDLTSTATSLREEVMKLKQQIMTHVNSGCQVMLSPNLL